MIQKRIKIGLYFFLLNFLVQPSNAQEKLEMVPGEYLVKFKNDSRAQLIQRATIETPLSAIKNLMTLKGIEYAEPNYIYNIERTPTESRFKDLWAFQNSSGPDIGATPAWDIETGSENVVVAVIDSGIDFFHPDLKNNLWVNQVEASGLAGVDDDGNGIIDDIHGANFSEKIPDGNLMDQNGHGTHCGGIISAAGDDGQGVVGVTWRSKIMAIKFVDRFGAGPLDKAAMAVDYAVKMGAHIINASWGSTRNSVTLKAAIQRAHEAGILFVSSAGNGRENTDLRPHYPSNYGLPNMISVAAVNQRGQIADFSNYGSKVDLGAPGVNILSTHPLGTYVSWSGTSTATPFVSGVAALLKSQNLSMKSEEIKERILNSVQPFWSLRGKTSSGGLLNAFNALTNTEGTPDENDPIHWSQMNISVSSPFPYLPNSKLEFQVRVPGAKEMSLYINKMETEKVYDKVSIYDSTGKLVAVYAGDFRDEYSPVISGDSARITFESDEDVEKSGFEITRVGYR